MKYNTFQNKKISALGFGSMRLPVLDEDPARIDVAGGEEMVDYAIPYAGTTGKALKAAE